MTPLLDAVGAMIAWIDGEIVARADRGLPIEDQVVVIITDALENASREFSGQMVSDLIAARRERAWPFAFLGADEEAIRDSVAMGVAERSSARWEPTKRFAGDVPEVEETTKYRSMEDRRRRDKSESFFDDENDSESSAGS